MKRQNTLCAVAAIVLTLTLTACNQTPDKTSDTRDADIAALKANEAQWVQDYAAKDVDKVAAHYADDAVLMIPGAPPVVGKDAIHTGFKPMLADPALSLKFEASKVDVAKSGDLAYTEGSYTMTLTDPQTKQIVHDHGSYVTTYRKQPDGAWKATVDIVNSDVPPPPAPSAKK
jgi:uncharacterized protein (TIGR02246 family)